MNKHIGWVHVCAAALSASMAYAGVEDPALEKWMVAIDCESVRRTTGVEPKKCTAEGRMEADVWLPGLLGKTVPVSLETLQLESPSFRAADASSEVWLLSARGNTADYTLGARRRGDFWQPVYFSATGLPVRSQASFGDARALVLSIVLRNKTAGVELSAVQTLLRGGRTRMSTWGGKLVKAPWDACWVFMVDDDPRANWAHPCRYVFVSADLSSIAVRYALTPLAVDVTSREAMDVRKPTMEVIVPFVPDTDMYEFGRDAAIQSRSKAISYEGNASNCYAVIISGGYNAYNNHIRYWGDSSFIYSTLSLKYGYPKTNIYALISDGLDPAIDRSDGSNSPTDLDGDGISDTYGAATSANVSNVFLTLQSILRPTDQLFVFCTDHGSPIDDGDEWDVLLYLWGGDVLRDTELKALTGPIACPVFFVMEQCYGGGFLNDLDQTNRAIATAAHYDESSYAGNTYPWFDEWCYHWTAAIRGFYPQTNAPWVDTEPCNADFNNDSYVSFDEAGQYAMMYRYGGDNPMYGENPSGLGKQLLLPMPDHEDVGMGEFGVGAIADPQVANSLFPVQITARNVFGDTMTNYCDPVVICAEAQPVDPGVYVGNETRSWGLPMETWYCDARTQVIYPSSLLGEARVLEQIAMDVAIPPSIELCNWTIRVKHTSLDSYSTNAVWESAGWTVVYASNQTISATGWVTFAFSQPFVYDGQRNLMVDFSFNNTNYDENGWCRASKSSNNVSVCYGSDNLYGDPLDWVDMEPVPARTEMYPNIRFGPSSESVSVRLTPTNSAAFSGGVWTGLVAALDPAAGVRLWVSDTNDLYDGGSDWFCVSNNDGMVAIGDYTGDSRTDMAVYDRQTGLWNVRSIESNLIAGAVKFGGPGFVPVLGDYDGDSVNDIAVYQTSTGMWYVRTVSGVILLYGEQFGGSGFVPVQGDYNGDGTNDLAVYEQATGLWYIRFIGAEASQISDVRSEIVRTVQWGSRYMIPVPGDYDGDGTSDLAVYDEQSGNWCILGGAEKSDISNLKFQIVPTSQWGGTGFAPVPGDFSGDGISDLAVYEQATGKWFIRTVSGVVVSYGEQFGGAGYAPLSGDYTGDGKCDLAVYDTDTGKWYVKTLNKERVLFGEQWGGSEHLPAVECDASLRPVGLNPVYRLLNHGTPRSTFEHFFTPDIDEVVTLEDLPDWSYETVCWYALSSGSGDAVALYRVHDTRNKTHYWTTDSGVRDALVGQGWADEGVSMYVWTTASGGRTPVHRFYNAGIDKYLFTADANERDALLAQPAYGYVYRGIAFYVYSNP